MIIDNVIIAYEALHTMTTRQKGRIGSMALKLDMAKAYERIEWIFLQGKLEKMGFWEKWVSLIMACVTIVSYFTLINGHPARTILLTRGIRQGDPISSYLFVLCAEGLSSLLTKTKDEDKIKGICVSKWSQPISHLFLIDDSILFYRAKLS